MMSTRGKLNRHPLTLSVLGTGIGVLVWMLRAILVSDQSNAQDSGVLPLPPAAVIAAHPVEAGDVPAATNKTPNAPVATVVNATTDAGGVRHKRHPDLMGEWENNDSLKRSIAVNADGTAVMQVKLDVLTALRYGPEMTLNLKWLLEQTDDGWRLTHTLIDGQPEASVNRLISDWGDERVYMVIEFDDDFMLLETIGSSVKERWTRSGK